MSNDSEYEMTIYGQTGLAVFLVIAGTVLVLDDKFPDGTIFLSGAIIMLFVAFIKKIKG